MADLRIAEASAWLYRVPLPHEINDARQDIRALEYLLVTLVTGDGTSGTGWAYTTGVGGRAALALFGDCLRPALLGLAHGGFELGMGEIRPTETPGHGVTFEETKLAPLLVVEG